VAANALSTEHRTEAQAITGSSRAGAGLIAYWLPGGRRPRGNDGSRGRGAGCRYEMPVRTPRWNTQATRGVSHCERWVKVGQQYPTFSESYLRTTLFVKRQTNEYKSKSCGCCTIARVIIWFWCAFYFELHKIQCRLSLSQIPLENLQVHNNASTLREREERKKIKRRVEWQDRDETGQRKDEEWNCESCSSTCFGFRELDDAPASNDCRV